MDLIERARKYLDRLESPRRAASDDQDSHAVVFGAAVVLVQGFAFNSADAEMLLREFCDRSDQPWTDREIAHKLRQAGQAKTKERPGWLVGSTGWKPSEEARRTMPKALPAPLPKVEYDNAALSKVAAPLKGTVDLIWLANRSWVDPAGVTPAEFLGKVFDPEREKVVVFRYCNAKGMPVGQGDALWPDEQLPVEGKNGVWYLCAPVDGKWRESGELDKDGKPKMSRRNGQCVLSWRWMVIESDQAPAAEWLAAIARLPLRIAALYTSGGRSVHALVRTPARTKEEWDEFRGELKPALVMLGADPGCMSAVRLTRLPGADRHGSVNKAGVYVKYDAPRRQKLLYLDPRADGRPLCEMPELRDVEAHWCGLAAAGVADADETGGQWIADGLSHYASRSRRCAEALKNFRMRTEEPA